MAKRAVNTPSIAATTLPHDWRSNGLWRITAMLARIPNDDYLLTVRAFEVHHIAAGTVSPDWRAEWRAWCRGSRPDLDWRAPEPEEAPGLFG